MNAPERQRKCDLIVIVRELRETNRLIRLENRHIYDDVDKRIEKELSKLQTVIRNKDKDIEVLEEKFKRIYKQNRVTNARYQSLRKSNRNRTDTTSDILAENKKFKEEVSRLTKDLHWPEREKENIELIIRTIFAYNILEKRGVLSYNEFCFLLIGSQLDFFNMKDIKDRFSELTHFYKRDFRLCLAAGYFRKVDRKGFWNLTVVGAHRLNDILQYIYEQKAGKYRFLNK